jgi:class 3 adenylate cyclase
MGRLMPELPVSTITLLFADIERSTALLQELGPERYSDALAEYRRHLGEAVTAHGGTELGTEGDGYFAAVPSVRQAVAAASEAQRGSRKLGK